MSQVSIPESLVRIMTTTMADTDQAIRAALANRTNPFVSFEDQFKNRITYRETGPHPWDMEFLLDDQVFLRRKVEDEGDQQCTVYYAVDEETVH